MIPGRLSPPVERLLASPVPLYRWMITAICAAEFAATSIFLLPILFRADRAELQRPATQDLHLFHFFVSLILAANLLLFAEGRFRIPRPWPSRIRWLGWSVVLVYAGWPLGIELFGLDLVDVHVFTVAELLTSYVPLLPMLGAVLGADAAKLWWRDRKTDAHERWIRFTVFLSAGYVALLAMGAPLALYDGLESEHQFDVARFLAGPTFPGFIVWAATLFVLFWLLIALPFVALGWLYARWDARRASA